MFRIISNLDRPAERGGVNDGKVPGTGNNLEPGAWITARGITPPYFATALRGASTHTVQRKHVFYIFCFIACLL